MKICSGCELNYINDNEELCDICKQEKNLKYSNLKDDNKEMVEKILIPFLRMRSPDDIETFTKEEASFAVFTLYYPLLIECKNIDKEHCKQEVRAGNSSNYRYYIKPYSIHGKYYHICSQWTKEAKDALKIISTLMNKS